MKSAIQPTRLKKLLIREFQVNRKSLTRMFLTGTAALTLALCIPMLNRFSEIDSTVEYLYYFSEGTVVISFFIWMFLGASNIFDMMKSKQERIAFLTLPASHAEKFITRFIYITLGYGAVFAAGLIAADLIQALFALFTIHGAKSLTILFVGKFIHFLTHLNEINPQTFALGILGTIAFHAYCVGCGTLFRRHVRGFIIGLLAVFFMLSMVLSTVLLFNLFNDLAKIVFLEIDDLEQAINVMYWSVIAFYALFSIFAYWGSYKIFCRMQVINNKWVNL